MNWIDIDSGERSVLVGKGIDLGRLSRRYRFVLDSERGSEKLLTRYLPRNVKEGGVHK